MKTSAYTSNRAGKYVKQLTGYSAFIPAQLPPNPEISLDDDCVNLIASAHQALGRLDGLAAVIPDPDVFIYAFVRKEALLSSQIEGTQCSLEDVLSDECQRADRVQDLEEVSNYVASMKLGLARLTELPISSRLIREIHARLMSGVRGSHKTPGAYRVSQNWIGRAGANLQTADFIPPPPQEVEHCMSQLEKFIHYDNSLPLLIKAGLIHAQFETIHPFLDGNGRVGRLLITLLLCEWKLLTQPLLYLSYFFKANRTEYYSRLSRIRTNGDWESWIKFFLQGIAETASSAAAAAENIVSLQSIDRQTIRKAKPTPMMHRIFERMCHMPIQSVPTLAAILGANIPTTQRAMNRLIDLGIVNETTGQVRNRRFVYANYLNLITMGTTKEPG